MNRAILSSDALEDLDKACSWLAQENKVLVGKLIASVEDALTRIERNPESCSIYFGEFRYLKLHKFSYVLIFRTKGERIEILTVKHTSQEDDFWVKRSHG